ncbi:hypothetical protein STTU_2687 [Streptomyces sp. Tu6071]|nr:hypothetical protein STTU_2687 [Streptomyces sp. Tu6071]
MVRLDRTHHDAALDYLRAVAGKRVFEPAELRVQALGISQRHG